MWSCAVPKEQQDAIKPNDANQPNFVFDIRYDNSGALTDDVRKSYLGFLAGGGGMFVMGENDSFGDRDDSILSLVSDAGGGTLSRASGSSQQTIYSPFDKPNEVTSINYQAPGLSERIRYWPVDQRQR